MKGYDTNKPPKLKECISKIVITGNTPKWLIEAYMKHSIRPESFKVDKKWQKTFS